MDAPHYSESEPCGGAVTVSFSKYLFLGKWCILYSAPHTCGKRAADRWSLRNFLPRSSLYVVGKAQKSPGPRSELCSAWKKWIGATPDVKKYLRYVAESRRACFELWFQNLHGGTEEKNRKPEMR
jgi:hypothetical protein